MPYRGRYPPLLVVALMVHICFTGCYGGDGERVQRLVDESAYSHNHVAAGADSAGVDARYLPMHATAVGHHWGYDKDNGPSVWHQMFPDCGGSWQSPVALDTTTADNQHNPRLHWFGWRNVPVSQVLSNSGHTVMLTSTYAKDQDIPQAWLSGSSQRYILSHVHFHWGSSEHTLNGKRYPMEMHVVTFDKRYRTVEKARLQKNGILVLAYFFGRSPTGCSALQKMVVGHLPLVVATNSSQPIQRPLPVSHLAPHFDKAFLLYHGSLTTPPCSQTVQWVLSKHVQAVSQEQLRAFAQIQNNEGNPLKANWRPLQPLNGRAVVQVS